MKKFFPASIAILIAVVLVTTVLWPERFSAGQDYPKLANIFYAWQLSDADVTALAKWDVVLLDMDQQARNPQKIRRLRELNPNIKIIAYIASQEIKQVNFTSESFLLSRQLADSLPEEWFVHDAGGQRVSWWSGSWLLNVSDDCPTVNGYKWNTYLPYFINNKILSSGLWDGVILDNTWDNISYFVSTYDLNRDGRQDDRNIADQNWRAGLRKIITTTRQGLSQPVILIGNGSTIYSDILDGVIFENFPVTDWSRDIESYRTAPTTGDKNYNILNRTTGNQDRPASYQSMRYGLASALLGDGYYAFDYGDQAHAQTWYYDEYDVDLGSPVNGAQMVSSLGGTNVWRRDFANGVVFVNASDTRQAVNLGSEILEKITGAQDKNINDGTKINYLRLEGRDGIVLKRTAPAPTSRQITGQAFVNGSFVRIFDQNGLSQQSGFYIYRSEFSGRNQIIVSDVDRDGQTETLVANSRNVVIYNAAGQAKNTFYPYGENYNKGINISIGDLNGDGTIEIITGTENGGGPHIRVFNDQGKLINPGFFAYGEGYRGGVNVAVGDLNGDGINEIIAGAGVGGGPHIRIFNKDGKLLSGGWFAYDEKFRGGVNVAVGDINADGKAEIVSAPGRGGQPEIKIWDSKGGQVGKSWSAFDASNRSGVELLISDINADGRLDILATSVDVF